MPRVSIITPTINRSELLSGLWDCVKAQSFQDFEWLVHDGSSERAPMFDAINDQRVSYIHAPEPMTIGAKRNVLCSAAKGEIIVHFDDDDFYGPRYVDRMVSFMTDLNVDFAKLFGFFLYHRPHDTFAYLDLETDFPFHFLLDRNPQQDIIPLRTAASRASLPASGLAMGGRNRGRGTAKWGYGFSYVFSRRVWEEVRFPDQNHGEDRVFANQAVVKFKSAGKRDFACSCLHIIHTGNTSVACPQQILPTGYLPQLFPDFRPAESTERAELGGWGAWNSRVQEARRLRTLGDEGSFVRQALAAFNMRPQRAEPLYELARFYREKGMNDASALFSEAGLTIERPEQDALFLEDFVYTAGLQEEYSVAANYARDPARKDRGFAACNWLALHRAIPHGSRELARSNLFFYVKPAATMLPSFAARRVEFSPPGGYRPVNPSATRLGQQIVVLLGTVDSESIEDENGPRYQTLDNGPIHTRNFLLRLSADLDIQSAAEILRPADMPEPACKLVLGFQDLRLFTWRSELWGSGCLQELTADGWCEQVLARIDGFGPATCRLTDWRVLRPERPRGHEKNWMPAVAGDRLQFISLCDPTRVVDDRGSTVTESTPAIAAEQFNGGSQLITFDGGWLALIHEVQWRNRRSFYQHRFVWFDETNMLHKVSRPFFFHKKGEEFAAGLAWHPDGERLLITFGVAGSEAWIATVSAGEVRGVLEDAERLPSGYSACARDAAVNLPRPDNRPVGTVVQTKINGQLISFFVTNANDEIMGCHYRGAFYETEELDMIKRNYTQGGTFVDIGANIGNHAIYISRFTKSSRIIVFEPNQTATPILKENLRLNQCNNVDTRFLGIALGAKKSRLRQNTHYSNNLGLTCYTEDASGDVQAVEGDALILDEPVEFIKIDVEGMEIEVLSGLQRTVRRWRPTMFIEVSDRNAQAFLDWCARASYQITDQFQRYKDVCNYLIKPISNLTSAVRGLEPVR